MYDQAMINTTPGMCLLMEKLWIWDGFRGLFKGTSNITFLK